MKNIKFIYISLSVFLLFSCETYLDEPNPNAPDLLEAVNNLGDTEKVLSGTYNSLFNHYILSLEEDNFRSDIGSMKNRINPTTGLNEHIDFYFKTYNASTRRIDQRWGALYRGIFFANQTLAALDQIKSSLAEAELQEWNEQRAQALFFRATYHFYLHSVFNEGKIIIRDDYQPDVTQRSKTVSSSEEVRAFFRKDLEEAIPYLPMPSEVSELGRITKGAATMILANSYLYESSEGNAAALTKATTLFESLRDDFGYSLETDMSKMFTSAGEFNSESIFEIPYTNSFGTELDEFDERSPHNRLASRSGHFNYSGQDFMQPATWLIFAYENDPLDATNPVNTITTGAGTQDTRRVSLRASAMLFLNDDLDTPVYNGPNVLNSGTYGGLGSKALIISGFKKYTNHDLGAANEVDANNGNRLKSGKNVIVNRLPEVLINLAECYFKQGKLQEGINEINKIRNRWALQPLELASRIDEPEMAYDENSLMDRLMYFEKPLELSLEGMATRIIDLRRWGIAAQRYAELSETYYQGVFFPRAGRRPITTALAKGPNTSVTRALSDVEIYTESVDGLSEEELRQQNVFNEFAGSSTNYSINNGYLPIPAEEVLNNNDINN